MTRITASVLTQNGETKKMPKCGENNAHVIWYDLLASFQALP